MSDVLRVLYAEDNAVDADLTRAHFARAAPDVALDIVGSGEECLAKLAQGKYDAVLLDHHLPGMDGIAVLRALVAREESPPVVMVTGVGDEALVVRALGVGACDYVPKHGDYLDTLPAVLKRAAAEHHGGPAERQDAGRRSRRILYVEHN